MQLYCSSLTSGSTRQCWQYPVLVACSTKNDYCVSEHLAAISRNLGTWRSVLCTTICFKMVGHQPKISFCIWHGNRKDLRSVSDVRKPWFELLAVIQVSGVFAYTLPHNCIAGWAIGTSLQVCPAWLDQTSFVHIYFQYLPSSACLSCVYMIFRHRNPFQLKHW